MFRLAKTAVEVDGTVPELIAVEISATRFGYSAVARIAAFICEGVTVEGSAPSRIRVKAKAVESALRLVDPEVERDAKTMLLFASTP